MVSNKSLDDSYKIIAALLHDVQNVHGGVFSARSLRLTLRKVRNRMSAEGMGFLTKTLPRLGKAFDKTLSSDTPLNSVELGFDSLPNSKLPRFLGELFSKVLGHDGTTLPAPCALSVRNIRDILYAFYKYELPYSHEQENKVVQQFIAAEHDLLNTSLRLETLRVRADISYLGGRFGFTKSPRLVRIVRVARRRLARLFANFDPLDIHPRHGPGAVATKQRLWDKFRWSNVSANITAMYPLDAYYFASLGHVCDDRDAFKRITEKNLPARVLLVPKDSRGPRLISCEPVDYQWIQQGLGKAIVDLVERHPLTKWNVHFTDQQPNQFGALLGSRTGKYATLDLKEASDRISVSLVRLLFPERIYSYLEACRSSSTELPDGSILNLKKFAPMGSSLCFPILALTIWAILSAAAPDADTRESILVYGDDVIVPTAFAEDAIEQLESFGLLVNRDKSCIKGLFRESCGTDAFNGINVTPVRLRTVWSSTPSPEVYTSWIAYANSYYDKQYHHTYDEIVSRLTAIYGPIPTDDMNILSCPSLRWLPEHMKPNRSRVSKRYQKRLWHVWTVKSPAIHQEMDGWSMLLRYFSEVSKDTPLSLPAETRVWSQKGIDPPPPFSVRSYTKRKASMLVKRWR